MSEGTELKPPTSIPVSAARTCAKCMKVTDAPICEDCKEETTPIIIPQHILYNQLVKYVVQHLAALGTKIDNLTTEIRTQNELELKKKRFNQLKNQVLASLSKTLKEEKDNEPGEGSAKGD